MAGPLVSDIAQSILAATASNAGLQLAGRWVSERYAELVGRTRTRQLQHSASVFVPAPISTGTCSITQNNATAVLSTPLTQNVVGWTIRFNTTWYIVTAQAGDNITLTIDSKQVDTTNATNGYILVQRFIPIMADARWISDVVHQRRNKKLRHYSLSQMESKHARRQLVGAYPWCWTEASRYVEDLDITTSLGSTGQKLVEIYPPSSQAETYKYYYWSIPLTLALNANLPQEIDAYTLREGVLVDVYRYKSEQFAEQNNREMAEFYANKESRQRTVWEGAIQEALIADNAYHNEVSVNLTSVGYAEPYDDDITNAHDYVIASWTQ